MIWDGQTVYTLWGYKPITTLAIRWKQLSTGYWQGLDRGVNEDILRADVVFQGPLAELQALETVLGGNRNTFSATLGEGEEIFGADIPTGTVNVTVEDYGEISRVSAKQFAMAMRLRLPLLTYRLVTPSLAPLELKSHRYKAYSEFDLRRKYSYDFGGGLTTIDHATDPGIFEAEFSLRSTDDMAAVRRFLFVQRANPFQFPDIGVDKPFGQRYSDREYCMCHAIDWEDLGRESFTEWGIRIRFAKADPYFSAGSEDSDTIIDHLTAGTSGSPSLYGTPGG